ncbi:transposon TX1 putative protein, partial [Trifolium medium]|nr:transposon TX1 putative protein [Trifolium medium]
MSEEDNLLLVLDFKEEEIKEAVWDCEDSKSPGPDGVTFDFLKEFWEEVKGDFFRFISEFRENGRIV